MDQQSDVPAPPSRAARIKWEAEKLAAAQREIDAGMGISGPELDEWMRAALATDEPVWHFERA